MVKDCGKKMDIIIKEVRETREEIKKLNEKNDESFNKNKELVEKVEYKLNSLTDSSDEIFISVSKILNIWYSILINYNSTEWAFIYNELIQS